MALASIANKLNTLNTTYLDSKSSPFLGSSDSINTTFTDSDTNVVEINRAFNNSLGTYTTSPITATSASITPSTNIYIFNAATNTYNTPITIASYTGTSQLILNNTTNFTSDINCMCLLPTASAIPSQFFCLQALYAWYSLFDATNWKLYKNGQEITLRVPDFATGSGTVASTVGFSTFTIKKSSSTNSTPMITSTATQLNSQLLVGNDTILTLMQTYIPASLKIFDSTKFNPYVARRIIHLYIILIQFNIALTYYKINPPVAAGSSGTTPVLIDDFYKLLQALNKNVTDTTDGVYSKIIEAVGDRAQIYNKNQQDITSLNADVTDLKNSISTDSSKLESRLSYQSKVKKYQIAAIVMLIIIGVGAALLYTLPLEYKQKLSGGGTLIILAVLTSIVLQYQNSKTLLKEGFADINYATGIRSGGLTNTWNDSAAGNYYDQMLNESLVYVNNTFILAASLDSYHLYGNVNYAGSRELQFFGDTKTSLDMKDRGLKDIYNISYMDQIRFSALMNLAVSLSLIIAVTVTFTLALENFPSVKNVILVIGGALALVSVTLYILEISTRVHTKPKQIYWGANTDDLKTAN